MVIVDSFLARGNCKSYLMLAFGRYCCLCRRWSLADTAGQDKRRWRPLLAGAVSGAGVERKVRSRASCRVVDRSDGCLVECRWVVGCDGRARVGLGEWEREREEGEWGGG
jgi:hypothetical protein